MPKGAYLRSPIESSIKLDGGDFARLMREFDVYKKDVQEALRDAAGDTLRAINAEFGAIVASHLKLDASIFRNRIKLAYSYQSGAGRVWFGINDITLRRLGEPYGGAKQEVGGVRAGPVFRERAFIVPKLNDHIFARGPFGRGDLQVQTYSIQKQPRHVLDTIILPRVRGLLLFHLRRRLDESSKSRR